MSMDTKELTPKQLRQLEKEKRRKGYADLAIQGTNNSSIASKRSVEMLYHKKMGLNRRLSSEGDTNSEGINEYFKFFVPKTFRRSPCINRGYWLRIEAIRSKIDAVYAAKEEHQKVTVVNLGCGFDPLPFQLLDKSNSLALKYPGISFVDIDYPDLIQNKITMIKNSDALLQIVGDVTTDTPTQFSTSRYTAVACNMNDTEAFGKLLTDLGDNVKIFVAEVSLAYMKPELADKVIEQTATVSHAHFVILEQLLQSGENEPFSRRMLYHFKKNDSPLQSVHAYHSIKSQIDRFHKLGYSHVNACDMYQFWQSLDEKVRDEVEALEPFDEYEEFLLFGHHYIILHASVDPVEIVFSPTLPPIEAVEEMQMSIEDSEIERKFHSAAVEMDGVVTMHGGNRLDTLLTVGGEVNVEDGDKPCGRACHTLTKIAEDKVLLIGGRTAPNKPLQDSWLLSKQPGGLWKWFRDVETPAVFRHTSFVAGDRVVVLGGGHNFAIYNGKIEDVDLPVRRASAVAFKNVGVEIGGATKNDIISDSFVVFDENLNIINEFHHPFFKRYGAKVEFIDKETVLLIGGIHPDYLLNQTNTIIKVNVVSGAVISVKIPDHVWEKSPLLVGFQTIVKDNTVLVIGGGAVCYGFGSVWNSILKIHL